jgi:MoaA/NifB/PqqE/SkfB family radical SAM enzyme
MQKALFINPPIILQKDFIDYPYFANYYILEQAGRCAKAGFDVSVLDAFAQEKSGLYEVEGGYLLGVPLQELLGLAPQEDFDLVVILVTPFSRPWEPHAMLKELVSFVRKRYASATLVLADCHLGGMNYVEYDGKRLLSFVDGVDCVLRYAGHVFFDEPWRLLELKGKGVEIKAPLSKVLSFPMPMFEAVNNRRLSAFLSRVFSGKIANPFSITKDTRPYMCSQGCPYRCIFCTSNPGYKGNGKKVYVQKPLDVIKHQTYLLQKITGATKIFVLDDVANLHKDFVSILKYWNSLGLLYEFPNGLRADRITEEVASLLKGHVTILPMSIESASDIDLEDRIRKKISVSAIKRALEICKNNDVPTMVHYIIGFPWETKDDVMATLSLAYELWERFGATPAVQFATPTPGSELYDAVVRERLIDPDSFDISDPLLFQHKSAFVPPKIPPNFLERALWALGTRMNATQSKKIIINVTYRCLNDCVFCAVSNRIKKDIPLGKIKEILEKHRQEGVDLLDLDGGEPTVHPFLCAVVRFARSLGYREINVTTNARLLKDRKKAWRLLRSGVTSVLVSVHGATKDVHDATTTKKGSFAETMAGLRNLCELARNMGVSCGVNTTVWRGNAGHLLEIGNLLCDLGVHRWNIQLLTPFGSASSKVEIPREEAARCVVEAIKRFKDRLQIQVVNAELCLFEGFEDFVVKDTQKMGRVMVFVSEEEVNLFKYIATKRKRVEKCFSCPYTMICEGVVDFGGEEDGKQ